jgi:GH15 family glucan-1,4-alpha-glucosidase
MPSRIEDYALVGDCQTAGLVSRDGSLDWLCLPRFDSGACFAALLGEPHHGRWLLAPRGDVRTIRRRHIENTLVLETEFETPEGVAAVIDFMPIRSPNVGEVPHGRPHFVRLVEGRGGRVPFRMELILRFEYGSVIPWVQKVPGGIGAVAGPDSVLLHTPVPLHGKDLTTVAEFSVGEGESAPFVLSWHPSYLPRPEAVDGYTMRAETEDWWRQWSSRCISEGAYSEAVVRSLITLKALTYSPTGGIVAAPTTSLPEQIGGVRNWDYRYCWLRDATFTLTALLNAGYHDEASAWREWLLRAVAGDPGSTQIMYGLAGERRLMESELSWLPGYEGSKPVRIGNAASGQFQLDVYGEVLGVMWLSRKAGLQALEAGWNLERALVQFVESAWQKPDEGLWEVRGPRRHFTHSKMMAWLAVDRAIASAEQFHLDGPVDRWRQLRDTIHREVCERGFDPPLNSFVQYYGSKQLDASLLMMPLVGFLPASDPRVAGTVAAISKHLCHDGFVARYDTATDVDHLPAGEGAFLAGGRSHPAGPPRRGARGARAPAGAAQRRRSPLRGVRSAPQTAPGQLPAGVFSRRAGQHSTPACPAHRCIAAAAGAPPSLDQGPLAWLDPASTMTAPERRRQARPCGFASRTCPPARRRCGYARRGWDRCCRWPMARQERPPRSGAVFFPESSTYSMATSLRGSSQLPSWVTPAPRRRHGGGRTRRICLFPAGASCSRRRSARSCPIRRLPPERSIRGRTARRNLEHPQPHQPVHAGCD